MFTTAGDNAALAGGTIDGDLTITGDLKVEGGGSFTYDEIIEGTFYATGGAIKASSGNTDFVIDSPTGQSARLVIKSDAGGANNDWWYMIAAPDYTLSLKNYQTELFTFTHTGRLGIGTDSPAEKLDLYALNGTADIQSTVVNDSDYPVVSLRHARENSSSPEVLSADDKTGEIQFWGWDGNEYLRTG